MSKIETQKTLTGSTVIQQFKKTKEQVMYLLEHFPETRNNDFYLQILWLKYYGGVKLPFIPYEDIHKVSGGLETIRRTRQKIQNEEHLYPPTDPKITEARRKKEQQIREGIHKV